MSFTKRCCIISIINKLILFLLGCSQAYGVGDDTVPDERLSASSLIDPHEDEYNWPSIGRLGQTSSSRVWGPYKHPEYGFDGNWFQVDNLSISLAYGLLSL